MVIDIAYCHSTSILSLLPLLSLPKATILCHCGHHYHNLVIIIVNYRNFIIIYCLFIVAVSISDYSQ
jgi:hypothetical protein